MNGRFNRCTAVTVAAIVFFSQVAAPSLATARVFAPATKPGLVTAALAHTPPQRIAVPQPSPRPRMQLPPPASLQATVSHDTHVPHGAFGHAPPMLRPSEIDGVLTAARQRAAQSRLHPHSGVPPASRSVSPVGTRAGTAPGRSRGRGTRTLQFTAGTGINPWWRYQEETVPGGGRLMVNVGTGNLLLQDDDMSIPHKGIALAFRRTYNSQSQHDVNGADGAVPGMYGNGWTNTFDAHLSASGPGQLTVWDIDGAHYDYNQASDGTWTPPIGQHATLVSDGGAGMLWTKKSGTTYYFWLPANSAVSGSSWEATFGAYEGRLYEIIGRNRNTYLVFGYAFDNGGPAPGGKVTAISANTESGMTAMLTFIDVSGHRVLDHVTYPDASTSVSYGYDTLGNLTTVSRPPNNAAGARPVQAFGYYNPGGMMAWVASPRWNAPDNGAMFYISYDGAPAATATLSALAHVGTVNLTIPDGTGTVLQPGVATGAVEYEHEWFGTGGSSPWYHDTDGHLTLWVMDSGQHPVQTQNCTATSGWNCTGTWLVSNETWDASTNTLTKEVDPRGNETDYLYDAMGNTTAVGEPYTTTSAGSFRPTKLFDYDQYNNVIAYCDERASHAIGGRGDWTSAGPPTAGAPDALCATNGSSAHAVFTYPINPAPSYEPFGQLTAIRSPLGYTRTIGYDPAKQGGVDYGLPTSVRGTAIAQTDGSRTPFQTMAYDASGNIVCSSTDGNDLTTTTLLIYDSLNRVVAVGDPDDASVTNGCAKTAGIAGSAIVTRTTYFPNGQVATTTTPVEAAANVSTQFQYDLDGNVTSEQRHFVSGAGPIQKWYDGADRLVEVRQPTDVNDFYTFPWLTRYLYDLTQGGTVTIASSGPFHAYGGLYKTQEQLPSGVATPQWNEPGSANGPSTGTSNPTWQDTAGTAYDALDRAVTTYRNTGSGLMPVTNTYDGSGSAGLLSQKCNANNECISYTYDPRGAKTQATFNVTSSSTQNFSYDEVGHVAAASNSVGSFSDLYDFDGRKISRQETVGATSSRISYAYYDDGLRKSLDAVTGTQSLTGALTYTYRPDGLLRQLGVASTYAFSFAYTGGRRLTSRADTTGQAANILTYTGSGSPTSYGLVQSMTTPGFYETGMTYNAEGGQLGGSYFGFNGSGWYGGHLIQASYTTRGEVLVDTSGAGPTLPLYANGMRIQTARSGVDAKTASFALNAFQSTPVATNSASTCSQGQCDSSAWTYSYDPVGRQSAAHFSGSSADYINAKSYDAEDHLLAQTLPWIAFAKTGYQRALGYRWGPVGHPLQVGSTSAVREVDPPPTDFQYDTLVWDDDDLLFTVNSAGQIDDLKIADFGDYVPGSSNPLTVWDRDTNGQIYGCHTGGAASSVASSGFQQTAIGCGASSSFIGSRLGVNQTPIGRGGMLLIPKSDGFSDGQNTFQGVRTYDPQVGTWTTPDSYYGDVHDPMSQKPYMWNSNNPYAYSDPTGFIIEFHGGNAEQYYNDALNYFDSHHANEAVDLLKQLRDDPSHTFIVSVTSAGAREGMNADIAGLRGDTPAINWDSRAGLSVERGVQSPAMGLLHEAAHAWRMATDLHGYLAARNFPDSEYGDREEKRVIDGIERRTAQIVGEPGRYAHTDGVSCTVTTAVTGTKC